MFDLRCDAGGDAGVTRGEDGQKLRLVTDPTALWATAGYWRRVMVVGYLGGGFQVPGESASQSKSSSSKSESESSDVVQCGVV